MNFNSIIGHDFIKKQIENAINNQRFLHANIILGEDGIGKSVIAKEIGLKILNKQTYKKYIDLIEYKGSKKKIGIDEVRSLIEKVYKKPFQGNNKVIIIYNAHNMTQEAQNAFLKTIEEPPLGVYIILLCENLNNLLETIVSRCEIYRLHKLNKNEIRSFIEVNYPELIEKKHNLDNLIAFSDGIPGRIDKILKDEDFNILRNNIMDILLELNNNDKEKVLSFGNLIIEKIKFWEDIMEIFLYYIRDVLVYKETGSNEFIINLDKFINIKHLAEVFSYNKLNNIVNIIKDTNIKINKNVNTKLLIDSMLINMQEV
ncbi:DNA polymerase III subunit tau [Clostridium acetireducens DSM 10703]|uniref:DNA polymerase III subunit delta' n=1 Tax=Clostridium acetireducens DSM 10703 TaxID=1121290 RepID=A0A1E8EWA3_9CLOT|nr:DNA polymerase III subunit delta' [Clostridium acetireducens]OFI01532.1 DNA polymerase III subunit tau [Clostridium acetireducens DSM 10703]